MLVNLLILSLLLNESGATGLVAKPHRASGLQRAGALIKEPLNSHKQINDIILTGITDSLEETSYRLQVLRMHVGNACELVFTGYGFTKQPSGIDLINHRRKIAVELKNGYGINSIARREDFHRLKEFKRQCPRYIVIQLYLVLLMIRCLKESIALKVVLMSCPASISYSIYLKAMKEKSYAT